MKLQDVESALDLHQKAFSFLLDCGARGHAGSQPFDEATIAAWRNGDSCLGWVTSHYEQMPLAVRPPREQIAAFAHYLSSLFATSFSASKVSRNGEVRFQVRALPKRRLDGSRKSTHTKSREHKAATVLCVHALESLAAEAGRTLPPDASQSILEDPVSAQDLTLWTYAVQLVHRAHYASQGPAVYRLWLDLPENTRRKVSAGHIWRARQRLLDQLTQLTTTSTQ